MLLAMLTDIQRCQVETEQLDLTDQLAEYSIRYIVRIMMSQGCDR